MKNIFIGLSSLILTDVSAAGYAEGFTRQQFSGYNEAIADHKDEWDSTNPRYAPPGLNLNQPSLCDISIRTGMSMETTRLCAVARQLEIHQQANSNLPQDQQQANSRKAIEQGMGKVAYLYYPENNLGNQAKHSFDMKCCNLPK